MNTLVVFLYGRLFHSKKKTAHPPFPVLKVFFVSKIGEKKPKMWQKSFLVTP